jgi:hypothetical protein
VHREGSLLEFDAWYITFMDPVYSPAGRLLPRTESPISEPGKTKAGRWERPALTSPHGSLVEALGVWEGASTNGLGTVGGLGT